MGRVASDRRRRGTLVGPLALFVVEQFEDEDIEYHEKLRAAFLAIARRNRKRCLVFDTSRPADRVSVEIWKAVVKRLKP